MIELYYLQIFFLIVLILGILVFIIPLIFIKKKGNDPHGTHEGTSSLARLSGLFFFLWIIIIILFIFFNDTIILFWTFSILSTDMLVIIGMTLVSIGFIFEILGAKELGVNFRIELPKEETELITSGIYRVMRNPMVFSIYLSVIGTFFIVPNLLTLIILIFSIITFDAKARNEEKFLLNRFGKDYEEYKRKVGRYFPIHINKKN